MACKLFAVFVLFTLFFNVFGATFHRRERSIASNHRANREVDITCENRSPCGWAVYKPLSREIEYFMKNSCECPTAKKCVRTDDDISVSAYVYRCKSEDDKENSRTS